MLDAPNNQSCTTQTEGIRLSTPRQNECLFVSGGLAGRVAGRGRRVVARPGSGLPEEPVLYLALLSLGIATAVRDAAVAAGCVLGLLYLFPVLGLAISSPEWHRHLQQIAPMTAGLEIQASTGLSTLPLSPWADLGVLATWAAAALLAGGILLHFRDA